MCYFDNSPYLGLHSRTMTDPMQAFKLMIVEFHCGDNWRNPGHFALRSPIQTCSWKPGQWEKAKSAPDKYSRSVGIYCFPSEQIARNYSKDEGNDLSDLTYGSAHVIVELEIAGTILEFDDRYSSAWHGSTLKMAQRGYLAERARVVSICSGGKKLKAKLSKSPLGVLYPEV